MINGVGGVVEHTSLCIQPKWNEEKQPKKKKKTLKGRHAHLALSPNEDHAYLFFLPFYRKLVAFTLENKISMAKTILFVIKWWNFAKNK